MPTISFIIPTLNFAAFLPETLDSIVDEGYSSIEIVVFDGGSTDDTLAVLERYRAKFPALRVVSATERGNIDIDLNKAAALATGDYVWTLSADDVLVKGWAREVAERLEQAAPDLMLVPAIHCDVQMRPRRNYPILRDVENGPLLETIANDRDLTEYLGKIRTSEGLFSFCSACIVRREKLLRAPLLEEANGTCWRYSARLIAVLTDYPTTILVLEREHILKRGDNDSFSQEGSVGRFKIATVNWDVAIGSLHLDDGVEKAMLSRVKSDIPRWYLLWMSQFVRNRDDKAIYHACVRSRLASDKTGDRVFARVLLALPRIAIFEKAVRVGKRKVRDMQRRRWEARQQPSRKEPAR